MVCCKCCQGCALVCRFITNLWLIGAIVLSSFAFFSCNFVETRSNGAGIGLIRSEELNAFGNYECVESVTTENYEDWLFRWSKICGILAPIFGIGVLCLMLFECCCKVCCSKCLEGFMFFAALFSQGCTFLIYISSPCYTNVSGLTCRMGYGSVWSIIAFGLYLIASLFLCFSPKPDPTCCKGDSCKKNEAATHDEEQPEPAEENAAEATVVSAAVVQEEKKQPEDTKGDAEQQAVAEKEVLEETVVAAAAPIKEEEKEPVEEASFKEEEPDVDEGEEEVEVDLEEQVKLSVRDSGISARLEESKPDPSFTGKAPDPDYSGHGDDPDGDKFVGRSIKASPSLQTAPW